ncbi:hypothetical protein [Roseivirga misakiensis]|uniref:Uncharacterized protein n=1 Tax=Roseivirga misakiensis TaxID=1563681 RepID=A0A1E5T0T6_9BACT|nr:hypothetical protein [Roseivirga misakiensis]OEK04984.1 hypothetical protein BFP71_16285 [Roseivirga misakiensis]
MTKTFTLFIKAALTISVVLFFISFYYLLYKDDIGLDPDSMLLALLLVIFTGLVSAVLIIILTILHKRKNQ